MRRSIQRFITACVVCFLAVSVGSVRATEQREDNPADAWQALQAGEALMLIRHALAPGVGDPPEFDLNNCSTQRNLSQAGRVQAKAIGDTLRANGIVDATILSSQWCRCMDTAILLDMGEPEPSAMLNSFFQYRSTELAQTRELHESLRQWIDRKGEVKVLVTHQVNISALTGQFASSGEMLIVTLVDDEPVVLARIGTN